MLYNFLMVLHVLVVIALIAVILIQRGRSGGLVEALGGVESIFGTKTTSVMVKITIGLAIAFFATSISLAYISKQRGKSVVERVQAADDVSPAANDAAPVAESMPDSAVDMPAEQPAQPVDVQP